MLRSNSFISLRTISSYCFVCVAGVLALSTFVPGLLAMTTTEKLNKLPQDHAYQVVLRNYLSTLNRSQFEVPLAPIVLAPTSMESPDDLHRLWLLIAGSMPTTRGLAMSADNFTLGSIEGEDHIFMRTGARGGQRLNDEPEVSIHPADTVWWSTWDYPGNPYFGSRAIRNRAFLACAVDMMMLDHLHENGTHWVENARRSDFLGGTMIWLTYVYNSVKDDLPPEVRKAYETGLGKLMDRLTEWGPTAVNDNMDMNANVAMAYLSAAVENPAIQKQAREYVSRNLKRVHPSGMIRDAEDLDASYSGIALVNLIWAARASGWPELEAMVAHMNDLKGHMILPEPDGINYLSASHFSTRTADDMSNDQWSQPYRDPAAAMIADEALFLMAGGRRGRDGRWGFPKEESMRQDINKGLQSINRSLVSSDVPFTRCVPAWWPGEINYAHDYYKEGFYSALVKRSAAGDPLLIAPFSRPDHTFIRVFPGPEVKDIKESDSKTFLSVRRPNYGAVAYTGPIGRTRYMNFAGGTLSAFWTPDGGSIILGRTGNPVQPEITQQRWEDWRLWPTHALSGETADGKAFSSARIRRRVSNVKYEIQENSARLVFAGPIGVRHDEGRSTQDGGIRGEVSFRREMIFRDDGVYIETAISADGKDQVSELYEILPLFISDPRHQPDVNHSVTLHVGQNRVEASGEPLDGVTSIEVRRFGDGAVIEFYEPQRVRLSPELWKNTYQNRTELRNVMIDMIGKGKHGGPLSSHSVRYRIRPLSEGNVPNLSTDVFSSTSRDRTALPREEIRP